jgi:hypothetical protein
MVADHQRAGVVVYWLPDFPWCDDAHGTLHRSTAPAPVLVPNDHHGHDDDDRSAHDDDDRSAHDDDDDRSAHNDDDDRSAHDDDDDLIYNYYDHAGYYTDG